MDKPSTAARSFEPWQIEAMPSVRIGPGCTRTDLPCPSGSRAWIVDIEPGHEWPYADVHDAGGEAVYVISGELIEAGDRFGAGTYLYYRPHSVHRPRTEHGVRLFGFNLAS